MPDSTYLEARWTALVRELSTDAPFLICTHTHPESDAVGSALGLYHLLRAMGREARVVLEEPLYPSLRYLDPDGICQAYLPEEKLEFREGERFWLVDAGYLHRLGKLETPIAARPMRRICLDHHLGDGDEFEVALIDPSASSAGLLVAELWDRAGQVMPRAVARVLYSAIATDTGFYRFSNTDGRTLRMAARLLDMGVASDAAYSAYREFRSWGAMRVIVRALETLEPRLGGRLALFHITQASLSAEGVPYHELEGAVDYPRSVRDVEVIGLVLELGPNRCKINMRSKGAVDVNKVCRRLGGGGHMRAAGAKLDLSVKEALDTLEREVAAELTERTA